jgi:GNAT superfamily N-acetyltransferase
MARPRSRSGVGCAPPTTSTGEARAEPQDHLETTRQPGGDHLRQGGYRPPQRRSHPRYLLQPTRHLPQGLPKDERAAILGGTFGDLWGGWLELTLLWVAEPLRGQGYGARLLLAAEEEARTQGCRGVFLSTFGFQTRTYYDRFGYEVFGELPNYPEGHSLYFMKIGTNVLRRIQL